MSYDTHGELLASKKQNKILMYTKRHSI